MRRSVVSSVALVAASFLVLGAASFTPGAPGVGDPYYPLDGNGGYDVKGYGLDLDYTPATDALKGRAAIAAVATQNLSAFDLDLIGLTVRSISVNGRAATWTRKGQELVVTPAKPVGKGKPLVTVVTYDGVPATLDDGALGDSGVFHTDDGEIIAGQPHGAATWFPVNDHPTDKASYAFNVTVPKGLSVVANGKLVSTRTHGAKTTFTWVAAEPMASYLATVNTGKFRTTTYTKGKRYYYDAIDESLFVPLAEPRTGSRFLYSQTANDSWKRLTRTISVPAGGADLQFQIARDTEPDWDFAFVEAHTVGADDWTTLPDANGHTSDSGGNSCGDGWGGDHPFIAHYQTPAAEGGCTPTGTTGAWNAATGASKGYEPWKIDLGAYAGKQVEVSISYASDYSTQGAGVALDDVVVSTGAGTTSFEDDGDTLDGWAVAGPPPGTTNANDWKTVGTGEITTVGDTAAASLAREPEILAFLSSNFGPYPFSAAGGIITSVPLGFALETQTRPVYTSAFFGDQESGDSVVVHELTHQWYGDSLALHRWKDIWLNEGFASYAEWLWSEHENIATAQEQFDARAAIPADDPFWDFTIGDPGPVDLFAGQVYDRGAMTLHALRLKIGDRAFFALLKQWAADHRGGNVSTPQFIALAEKISGKRLGAFFTTWLYTPTKPAGIEPAAARLKAAGSAKVPVARGHVLRR